MILDKWIIDNESRYDKSAKLFPDKMSNFHGCIMTASTFPYAPFIFPMKENNSNVTHYSEGLEISVLQEVADTLNFKVQFLSEPQHDTSKWRGLNDEVLHKQSCFRFAAMPHTAVAIGTRDHSVRYLKETDCSDHMLSQEHAGRVL